MKNKKKWIVLLSGGLDSSANVVLARDQGEEVVLALTFDYGQKASMKEVQAASQLVKKWKIPHKIVFLPWFSDFTHTALLSSQKEIPKFELENLKDKEYCKKSAEQVWVPNRNGIFIHIAASYAESYGATGVLVGFNKEEASTFADNSPDFLEKTNLALAASGSPVQVFSYTLEDSKGDIFKKCKPLDLPFKELWPCYHAEHQWCMECESCLRFYRGSEKGGVTLFGKEKEKKVSTKKVKTKEGKN